MGEGGGGRGGGGWELSLHLSREPMPSTVVSVTFPFVH